MNGSGATGAPGELGITGLQGPSGLKGDRGDNGINGDRGLPGFPGPIVIITINWLHNLLVTDFRFHFQGAIGPVGERGLQGISIKGSIGERGPQGATGAKVYGD